MVVARYCLTIECLCFAAPALGQSGSAPVAADPGGQDIVVNGQTEAKSDWKRAETDHVVVFSKSGEGELRRVTKNLELLQNLMSRLYRRGDTSDDALKMQVTLIESQSRFRAMGLKDLRSQEGPFPPDFSGRRYYDPQDDGEVLAVARADQMIDLNTTRRFNQDCDDIQGNDQGSVPGDDLGDNGTASCSASNTNHLPVARSWEAVLYAAFAQHFMLTYAPAAYPRWYLDGIGALFSTIEVQRNGAMDYARPPVGYKDIFRSYGYPNVGEILTGRYLDNPQNASGQSKAAQNTAAWSPYGAWLIAHYFLFSKLKPERREQFQHYMTAVRQGTPLAEAAAVFGDMRKLQREIQSYANMDIAFAHADAPQAPAADPLTATLSATRGALVEARVGLESQLAALHSGGNAGTGGADWLAQLHAQVAQLPYDADGLSLEAEAECRSGHDGDCLATAERALAGAPDNVGALSWKGVALTDQAIAGPPSDRPARLAEARRAIERAIGIDGQAPEALIAYFQSFTKAGERAPEDAMRAMTTAIRGVPAAPGPRLYLAQELVRQGQPDLARRILQPVLYGGYDTPEKTVAEGLFPPARGGTVAGH
jgi:hypothetical protein